MASRELREALIRLLPSQLEGLLLEELTVELRAHVPPAPASLAARAQAVVVLAEQDAALMKRLEVAVQGIIGRGPQPPERALEARMRDDEWASEDEDVLFSWVHFSDLHFGHGSTEHRWDQLLVLRAIAKDLGQLTKEAGLRPDAIFVVPGNHDVQRSADTADKNVRRLVERLRSGEEILDNALGDPEDAAWLQSRQKNYQAFASEFAPACLGAGDGRPFWCHRIDTPRLGIRIAGLNTALLAADDEDKGKLWLGTEQLAKALDGGTSGVAPVVLILSHHPLAGGWLSDEKNAASWVRNNAKVHLCGHVHEAAAEQVISGGGKSFITVTAGASYGAAEKGGPPASHGYNLAALLRGVDGMLRLAIWPRRWSPKNTDFRVDVDNVDEGIRSVRDIPGVTVGPPRGAPEGQRSPRIVPPEHPAPPVRPSERVAEWIASAVEQHRWLPILGFQERYKIRLSLDEIFVPLQVRAGRRKCPPMRGKERAEDFIESREVDLPGALRMASESPDTLATTRREVPLPPSRRARPGGRAA